MTGNGGGKGEKLTDTQNTVLTMLETQNSDIICGIPTGFESSFITVRHLPVLVPCVSKREIFSFHLLKQNILYNSSLMMNNH